MFTILKKEFRSYLRRTTSYYFLAFMLAAIGCLITVYNIYYGFAKLEYIIPGVAIALGFALPLFTMNLFAKDRKTKIDRLIYSLPISNKAVVLGKYGALLCFIIICIAVLALVPVFLSFFTDIYFASAYLTLICFILFAAAMLALNTFISAATNNSTVSTLISYAVTIGAFVLYLIPTGSGSGVWNTIAETLRFLSPFSHLYTFLYGAFDITSIVYFILLTALFLFLAVRAYSRKRIVATCGKKCPELKASFSLSSALAVILAVCTVAIGTLVSFAPYSYSKFDMTSGKNISLTDETKEFISSINKDVDIYVINPDSSDKAFEHLVKLFDENSDKINVHFGTDLSFSDLLMPLGWDGVQPLDAYTLLIQNEDRIQIVNYPSFFSYYHPNYSQFGLMSEDNYLYICQMLIQQMQSDSSYAEMLQSFVQDIQIYFGAELIITQCIEYVDAKTLPQPYYLVGHGEDDLNASVLHNSLVSLMGVEFGKLDLSAATSLPENMDTLIINAPKTDLSESEAKMLSDYLANGGALTLITNDANISMKNLMSLVEAYGASAEEGLICIDEVIPEEAEETEETEETETTESTETEDTEEIETEPYDKYLIPAYVDATHESLASIAMYGGVLVKNANSIKISDTLASGVTVTPVLTTDETAYIENVENSSSVKNVAVAIDASNANKTATKILWFTGAESFNSNMAESILNVYATAYAVQWQTEGFVSELDSAIAPKLLGESKLTVSTGTRNLLIVVLIVLIPAAILILGFVLNRKRKTPSTKKKEEAPLPESGSPQLEVESAEIEDEAEENNGSDGEENDSEENNSEE